jgi:signal transduction histidine kinase
VSVEAEPVGANVDVAKVERIVENLLVNAGKHTPSSCSIWIKVTAVDEGALITVEDDGPGVAEEFRELIFEPFRQGPAEDPSPGSGIGLSLVLRFAELHGGRAWVEDREGGGSSFRVLLPRELPEAPQPIAEEEQPHDRTG